MSRVSCNKFFIKCLISTKLKTNKNKKKTKKSTKERSVLFPLLGLQTNEQMNFFFFMIHEVTRYTRYQSYRQQNQTLFM